MRKGRRKLYRWIIFLRKLSLRIQNSQHAQRFQGKLRDKVRLSPNGKVSTWCQIGVSKKPKWVYFYQVFFKKTSLRYVPRTENKECEGRFLPEGFIFVLRMVFPIYTVVSPVSGVEKIHGTSLHHNIGIVNFFDPVKNTSFPDRYWSYVLRNTIKISLILIRCDQASFHAKFIIQNRKSSFNLYSTHFVENTNENFR